MYFWEDYRITDQILSIFYPFWNEHNLEMQSRPLQKYYKLCILFLASLFIWKEFCRLCFCYYFCITFPGFKNIQKCIDMQITDLFHNLFLYVLFVQVIAFKSAFVFCRSMRTPLFSSQYSRVQDKRLLGRRATMTAMMTTMMRRNQRKSVRFFINKGPIYWYWWN